MSLNRVILRERKNIYKLLNDASPLIQRKENNLFLHDKYRYEKNKKKTSENTFVGQMSCGVCSFLLNYYLSNLGIETKIMKSTFGYGKYLEDHCFLLYKDIIIDPTFRQMFLGIKPDDKYSKYLFEETPFVFVGKYNDLENYYHKLSKIHNELYNIPNSNYENMIFWQNPQLFNVNVDLNKIKNCKEYSKGKGTHYLKLHYYLNDDINN